jgi:hypothetical protein
MGMTKGAECKCSSMEVNDFTQVRQDTLLQNSGMETGSKVV